MFDTHCNSIYLLSVLLVITFMSCVIIFFLNFLAYAISAAPTDSANVANITVCPRMINRQEWRAREPVNFEILPVTPTPYVVIHHGGTRSFCQDQKACSAIVRSYQNFHMNDRGWWDIGYNFLIGEDGNVYEGRGWDYVGAHAPGYNSQSIGICFIGYFNDFLPNEAALNALIQLVDCGVSLGKINDRYNIIGHRQTRSTECPGETLYKYVTTLPRWTSDPIPIHTKMTTTTRSTNNN